MQADLNDWRIKLHPLIEDVKRWHTQLRHRMNKGEELGEDLTDLEDAIGALVCVRERRPGGLLDPAQADILDVDNSDPDEPIDLRAHNLELMSVVRRQARARRATRENPSTN